MCNVCYGHEVFQAIGNGDLKVIPCPGCGEQAAGRLATPGDKKCNNTVTLDSYGLTRIESSRAQELAEHTGVLIPTPPQTFGGVCLPPCARGCSTFGNLRRYLLTFTPMRAGVLIKVSKMIRIKLSNFSGVGNDLILNAKNIKR
jgi:hypothetical protein